MPSNVILITGANRGIGKGLLQRYLAQPGNVVVAGNRDPHHPSSQSLADIPTGEGSRLIVVKIDATNEQDAFKAVNELRDSHGIGHLDMVIANAAISDIYPSVFELKTPDMQRHMETNVFGVVHLYQATRPLLQKSSREPIFATIGSGAGLLTHQPPTPNAAYGPSKAAVHWITVRINGESEWLNALVIDPGFVQTDMGNGAAQKMGLPEAPLALDTCCDGISQVLANSTKKTHGGKVVLYDGKIEEW